MSAALAARRALSAGAFSEIGCLKVRMARHAGEIERRGGDYFGRAPNKVAQLLATAHGGQVLLSAAVVELLSGRLPDGAGLCNLGRHRLRDLTGPEQIYQLLGPALTSTFPPLRLLDALPNNLPQLLTPLIGRDRESAARSGRRTSSICSPGW